jgi:hypothetical protein
MNEDVEWFLIGMAIMGVLISIYRISIDLRSGIELMIFLIGCWIATYLYCDKCLPASINLPKKQ